MKKIVFFCLALLSISCSVLGPDSDSEQDGDLKFLTDLIVQNNLNEDSSPYDKDNGDGELTAREVGIQKWRNGRLVKLELTILAPVKADLYNIRILPNSILQASELDYFILHNSELNELPDAICEHPSLKTLHLWNNKIENIPENIHRMPNLEVLQLGSNQIRQIPDSIVNAPKLRSLLLSANQIEVLPERVWEIKNWHSLSVTGNQLTELPDGIDNVDFFYDLSFADNQLKKLPVGFESIEVRGSLSIGENHLFCANGEVDASLVPENLLNSRRIAILTGLYFQDCEGF